MIYHMSSDFFFEICTFDGCKNCHLGTCIVIIQHNVKSFDEIVPVSIFPPKVRFMYIMYVSFNVILIMATISNSVLYIFVIKNIIYFFFYFKLTTYGRKQKLFIIIDDIKTTCYTSKYNNNWVPTSYTCHLNLFVCT